MDKLIENIQKRYEEESKTSCNLSCGSNLEYLQLNSGEKVLDLGCGRGKETILAAKMVAPNGEAVGMDITEAMIAEANNNIYLEKLTNIKFVFGDINNIPFDNNSFDAVISNCVINHAKNKLIVYKDIHRVLKPGGRFVISDAVTKDPLPDDIKNDPVAWGECFGGAITEDEYLKSIEKANFSKVEILKRREYIKNGYDFISLTIKAFK
ncbi:methyltransferase domain-containing protein [Clostridium grantii]|uniref:Arsenite methyltransferase n=1 Tax=Clostridium grantii DSM 8605 TaxID=1121316 RepID=A0A1M5VVB4_9CLOT|nr:methyltransferase domain-containing protein [Clostridium grantii]SHH79147.1 Methyltransferase domain-containing protein [Clostridium grantii DSM 8605]